MNEEKIKIAIPNARQKLKIFFPRDPKGDFSLVFRSKTFKLQKAYLRLESNYFKRHCTAQKDILEIKEHFNVGNGLNQQQYFDAVMSCFYGNKLQIPRNQVINFYPILKFLEVEGPLVELRRDMVQNVKQYDLFVLMRIAHKYSEQEVFQTCLIELENDGFQQIKQSTSQFLRCDVELFKLIIKTHNRKKTTGKGLDYKFIDDIIKQYCEKNSLLQESYHEFKFELIDKTKLTAQQYKEIFMDELAKNRNIKQSFIRTDPSFRFTGNSNSFDEKTSASSNALFQSFLNNGQCSVPTDLTIEMENIYQKKRNQELQTEKTKLAQQLIKLRQNTIANHEASQALQRQVIELKEKLKARDKQDKQQKQVISVCQSKIKQLQTKLKDRDLYVKLLQEKFNKIKAHKGSFAEQQNDQFQNSTIIPASLIGDLMKNRVGKQKEEEARREAKKKQQTKVQVLESMDEQQLQEKYHSRISFDVQPASIPKIMIPRLVQFLGTDGFSKRECNLVYRRSDKHPAVGEPKSIRQRNQLILLIKTGSGKLIGGYIKARIANNAQQYIEDSQAMIFQFNQNKKFKVMKQHAAEAIFVSDYYLISFGNDLMIARDCLDEASQCDWSSSYEKGAHGENPDWFAGGTQFMIKELEFYQVKQQQMEMVL